MKLSGTNEDWDDWTMSIKPEGHNAIHVVFTNDRYIETYDGIIYLDDTERQEQALAMIQRTLEEGEQLTINAMHHETNYVGPTASG